MMPWTALSMLFIGVYSRILRANILDTMNDDYVRTARAKGLSERQVMIKHVLRNSMIPIVTLWGLDFAAVLGGGAILTETVFDLQGVGQFAADVDRRARRAAGAGDHHLRRVLHRLPERDRRHHLRPARPEDPAHVSAEPLLSVQRPGGVLRDRGGDRAGGRRRLVRPRAGRDPGGGGGVRLGQVRYRDDPDGPDAVAELALRGHRRVHGNRAAWTPPTTSCARSAAPRSR